MAPPLNFLELQAGGPDPVLAALNGRHGTHRDAGAAAYAGVWQLIGARHWDALMALHDLAVGRNSAFRGMTAFGAGIAAAHRFDLDAAVALLRQSVFFTTQAMQGPLAHERAALMHPMHEMLVQALLLEPGGYGADGPPFALPPLASGGAPLVMACCDEAYFQAYAPRFLASLKAALPEARWLLHVMNPAAESEALRQRLLADHSGGTITTESVAADASYYASRRFMLCGDVLAAAGGDLVVCDIDSVFPSHFRAVLGGAAGAEVAGILSTRPGSLTPNLMVSAAFLVLKAGSALARGFCDNAACYLRAKLAEGAGLWTVDQTALFRSLCLLGAGRARFLDLSVAEPALLDAFVAPHVVGETVRKAAPSRTLRVAGLGFGPGLRPIVTLG